MHQRTAVKTLAATFALSLSLAACGSQDEYLLDLEGLSATNLAIINGEPPDAPEHQAVVSLHAVRGKSVYVSPFCSGTLIRPDVVLTAAHCLAGKKAAGVRVYVGDNPIAEYQAGTLTFKTVSALTVHPQYNSRTITNDIALMRLSAPVAGVTPVPEAPAGFAYVLGERLNFAGFGQDELGDFGVKLQVDGALDGFGCSLACGCPQASGDAATQICYQQSDAGPCFGDSGGPAFVYRSGAVYVAGMTSYGDSTCSIYGVSTRADAFEAFIHGFAGAN